MQSELLRIKHGRGPEKVAATYHFAFAASAEHTFGKTELDTTIGAKL